MPIYTLSYAIRDYDGDVTRTKFYIDATDVTLLQSISNTLANALDTLSAGAIVAAEYTEALTLPVTVKSNPLITANREHKGLMVFDAVGVPTRFSFAIPALDPNKVGTAGEIGGTGTADGVEAQAAVANIETTLLAAQNDYGRTYRGDNLNTLLKAVETFRRS